MISHLTLKETKIIETRGGGTVSKKKKKPWLPGGVPTKLQQESYYLYCSSIRSPFCWKVPKQDFNKNRLLQDALRFSWREHWKHKENYPSYSLVSPSCWFIYLKKLRWFSSIKEMRRNVCFLCRNPQGSVYGMRQKQVSSNICFFFILGNRNTLFPLTCTKNRQAGSYKKFQA